MNRGPIGTTLTVNGSSISGRGTFLDPGRLPDRKEVRIRKYLPFESRARLHALVSELAKRSMSYQQIQTQIFDSTRIWLSKGSISGWVRGIHNPTGGKNTFCAVASPELAYVIGVIAGDGNLNVHGYNYEMLLSVTDRDFAEEFSRCLAKILSRRNPYRVRRSEKRNRWIVQGSSVLLYQFLNRPWQNLKSFLEHCEECTAAFLKAFYDGEGCISGRLLRLDNTQADILLYIQGLLRKLGIETTDLNRRKLAGTELIDPLNGRIYVRNKDCFDFRIRARSLSQFEQKVGFTITRKQQRLANALATRPRFHPSPSANRLIV